MQMTARQCRLLAGLTQPELAELSGATISNIETGKCKQPVPVTLEKIWLALERAVHSEIKTPLLLRAEQKPAAAQG